jgi:glycosyltransferase involved in cell wall biosynthesis
MGSMEKIKCSVGILTFNSEKTLERALASVKDFSEIIIADGGSTDATLSIAKKYDCLIVDQYTKHHPGRSQYHPIEDFARERNILLQAATEDWFLYIDSDEYISETLREEIREIANADTRDELIFDVPIGNQNTDATITYKPWKQNYQTRFFSTKVVGQFERAVHERFVFDRDTYQVGTLKGKWFVPYSKPDFAAYKRAVDLRLQIMFETKKTPDTFGKYLFLAILTPLKRFIGLTYRMVMARILYSWKQVPPFSHYLNQCYSQWVTFVVVTRLYFKRDAE